MRIDVFVKEGEAGEGLNAGGSLDAVAVMI